VSSTCNCCRKREKVRVPESTTLQVNRIGGGNYNRPSRRYTTHICVKCAREIFEIDFETRSQKRQPPTSIYGYEVTSVKHALREFNCRAEAP
jgi:hypothetical protein